MTSPTPGWYPDPNVPQQMRWWDGEQWTEDTYERTEPLDGYLATPGQQERGAGDASASGLSAPGSPSGASAPSTARAGSSGSGVDTTTRAGRWAGRRSVGTTAHPDRAPTTDDGVPLAGWGWRVAARLVDGLVTGVIASLVVFPVTADLVAYLSAQVDRAAQAAQSGQSAPGLSMTDPELVKILGIISLAQLLVSLAYEMAFLLWKGGTPGKLLFGLRIRPWQNGQQLTPTVVAKRWVASDGAASIPNIGTFYYIVDVLWPLRDERHQALHDKFAGTCVVSLRR